MGQLPSCDLFDDIGFCALSSRCRAGCGGPEALVWRVFQATRAPVTAALVCLVDSDRLTFESDGSFSPERGLPFSQTWKSLLWHSAFLHSWNPEQRYTLNSALWLMGFEWQLSLCLPLFLALVRSKGWIALYVLAGALLVSYPGRWGYLPRFLFSAELTLPFLIGIGAARIARRPDLFFRGMKTPFIHFGLLLTCFAATLLHTLFVGAQRGTLAAHAASISIGAAIIYMTYFARCWPAQLLSHSVLRFIGRFSYSLFLLHVPLLMLFNGVCVRLDLPQSGRIYPFALLCFPLILLISYLFYCVFERPLQRTRASPDSRS